MTETPSDTSIERAVKINTDGSANFVTSADDRISLNAVPLHRYDPMTWASVSVSKDGTPRVVHFEEGATEEFVSIKFSNHLSVHVSLAQWEALRNVDVQLAYDSKKV